MLRALLYGLAILHLGPGLAFAALAFGCDPSQPYLGAICQRDTFGAFINLTLIFWLVLGAGAVALAALRRSRAKGPPLPRVLAVDQGMDPLEAVVRGGNSARNPIDAPQSGGRPRPCAAGQWTAEAPLPLPDRGPGPSTEVSNTPGKCL